MDKTLGYFKPIISALSIVQENSGTVTPFSMGTTKLKPVFAILTPFFAILTFCGKFNQVLKHLF